MKNLDSGMSTTEQQPGRYWLMTLFRAGIAAGASIALVLQSGTVSAQRSVETPLKEMGIVSGTVTAPKAFKAAHVYLNNVDKHITYMVYTSRGAFRAVALFPGNYEIIVRGRGLESDPQKLVVKAGKNPAVKMTMHATADAKQYPTSVLPSETRNSNGASPPKQELVLASYDEIYPAGPGRDVLEKLCMHCHGENFFPGQQRTASGWQFGLDHMMGLHLNERDKRGLGEGVLAGSASNFHFGLQDRKEVLEYLTKNFGPGQKPRAVRTDVEVPLDETQLAKAQYIEYYVLGGEETGETTSVSGGNPDSESAAGGVAGVRIVMQIQIDAQGNQWAIERSIPSRLVKLDPRTGEQKVWNLPDTRAGVHEVIIDRNGMVWVPEFSRTEDGRIDGMGTGSELTSRLLGFNPKTEKWEHAIDLDPDNVIRAKNKGPLMGATISSTGRICANWMLTGAIGCYDPVTREAATYLIPTPGAVPYGQTIDPFDNVWVSEWNGGKLGRYNFKNQSWTEFAPPGYPVNFRRGPNSDAEGNIWTGIWSGGNIPGKIAKLDPQTGTWTTWDIPHRGAKPYEASIDKDGNVWFPDLATPDHPIVIGRFNPRDNKFTFYPRPQFIADSTRVNHSADGSVHYTARYGSAKDTSAFGVLFPDKDQIRTLAPLMLNGAPGYPFKAGASKASR